MLTNQKISFIKIIKVLGVHTLGNITLVATILISEHALIHVSKDLSCFSFLRNQFYHASNGPNPLKTNNEFLELIFRDRHIRSANGGKIFTRNPGVRRKWRLQPHIVTPSRRLLPMVIYQESMERRYG